MDFETFRQSWRNLRGKGFVKSLRRGPTGVGHTLEQYLGLEENNIALPDFGFAELKSHRDQSGSLISLFTYNRKAWLKKPLEAIRQYGSLDKNGRLGLYYTLGLSANSAGLSTHIDDASLTVRHIDGSVVVSWALEEIAKRFRQKFPALIFVNVKVEVRDDIEWFWFYRARLLRGTSPHILQTEIQKGRVFIDLRLHDKGTSARNHGTGFRINEEHMDKLFSEVSDIDV